MALCDAHERKRRPGHSLLQSERAGVVAVAADDARPILGAPQPADEAPSVRPPENLLKLRERVGGASRAVLGTHVEDSDFGPSYDGARYRYWARV